MVYYRSVMYVHMFIAIQDGTFRIDRLESLLTEVRLSFPFCCDLSPPLSPSSFCAMPLPTVVCCLPITWFRGSEF